MKWLSLAKQNLDIKRYIWGKRKQEWFTFPYIPSKKIQQSNVLLGVLLPIFGVFPPIYRYSKIKYVVHHFRVCIVQSSAYN